MIFSRLILVGVILTFPLVSSINGLQKEQPIVSVNATSSGELIKQVYLPENTFNPSMGQDISFSIDLAQAGKLSIAILDRDFYVTYQICNGKEVTAGVQNFSWRGRHQSDDKVVANEAYTLKIDFISNSGEVESYFPAMHKTDLMSVTSEYYDRQSGILSYELSQPSRVHIQAGTAVTDPKTGEYTGPIYRTIVNREPRSAGKIAEYWSGFEQDGGSIFVPDLKNFAVAIAASPLPENSILSYGNSAMTFLEYAKIRTGKPVLLSSNKHGHHAGLMSYEDVSPTIKLKPADSTWSDRHRAWKVKAGKLTLTAQLNGMSSEHFAKQPGRIYIFFDGDKIQSLPIPSPKATFQIDVPAKFITTGRHTVAVNWASEFGPTAVGAVAVESSLESVRK